MRLETAILDRRGSPELPRADAAQARTGRLSATESLTGLTMFCSFSSEFQPSYWSLELLAV